MTWPVYALGGISLVLFVLLIGSVYLLYRLGRTVVLLEDQVEESLDILDACYKRIDLVTTTPVNFDDPLVKQVLAEIKRAREAVLLIANKIVVFQKDRETHGSQQETGQENR